MPITYGGDDYGWLATQGGVADLPVPQQVLDMEKRLMEASKAGQDTSAYWDQLRPYFESRYDPELFRANQAGYAAQQGDAQIKALGGVKITPEQLQQMKDVHAQGGIYSVLNPGLNVAPSADYAANRAAYQSQYTNPTATNAADFLASLRDFGSAPTVATERTALGGRERWTPTTPASTQAPVAKLADNVARATKGQYTPPSTNYSPVASAAASSPVQSNPMGGQSAFRTSRYKSPWLRYGAGRM